MHDVARYLDGSACRSRDRLRNTAHQEHAALTERFVIEVCWLKRAGGTARTIVDELASTIISQCYQVEPIEAGYDPTERRVNTFMLPGLEKEVAKRIIAEARDESGCRSKAGSGNQGIAHVATEGFGERGRFGEWAVGKELDHAFAETQQLRHGVV
jgi:hypothetical protein